LLKYYICKGFNFNNLFKNPQRNFMFLRLLLVSAFAVAFAQNTSAQTIWTSYNMGNTGGELINNASAIGVDNLGNVYIGTADHGITSFNGSSWTNTGFPNYDITSIFLTGTTVNVTTYYNGISTYSAGTWTTKNVANTAPSGMPDNETHSLNFDSQGNLWIASYSGLIRDSINGLWKTFSPGEAFYCIYVDPSNNKWAGTRGDGLLKFKNGVNTFYNHTNSGIPNDSVNVIARTSDGNLWIGTDLGLAKFDGTTWVVYNTSNTGGALPGNKINAISFDPSENIIVGTDGGVGMLIRSSNLWHAWTSANSNLPENNITSISLDPNSHDVWIATSSSGVAKTTLIQLITVITSVTSPGHTVEAVSVYPCPAQDFFNVNYNLPANQPVKISVLSLIGDELISFSQEQFPGQHNEVLNVARLGAGIYICRVQAGNSYADQKLVIIK
jgi:hypothetical protein